MFLFIFAVVILVICYTLESVIRSLRVDGFAQKYVFITGCDSGFGQKLAVRLDRLGFPVFAGCLTDDGQKFLSQNASTRLITLSLDVTKPESIQKALDFVKQKLPSGTGLWAVVNNAGISGPMVPTEMSPLDEFYRTLGVNLFGQIEMCRKFLPLLRKSKGRVVNMASIAGRFASVAPAYNISKFGVEGFSDSLRREVIDQGIKVSIIEPGFFNTDLNTKEAMVRNVAHFYNQAEEEVQTAYGKSFLQDFKALAGFLKGSSNLDCVVDAYAHAIVSQFPRTRYVVGWDARLFFIPMSFIQAGITDWIMRKINNITLYAAKKKLSL